MIRFIHAWPVYGLYHVNGTWRTAEPGETMYQGYGEYKAVLVGIHQNRRVLEWIREEMRQMPVLYTRSPGSMRRYFGIWAYREYKLAERGNLTEPEYLELHTIAGGQMLDNHAATFVQNMGERLGRYAVYIHGLSLWARSLFEQGLLEQRAEQPGGFVFMTEAAWRAIGWPQPAEIKAYRAPKAGPGEVVEI